MSWYVEELLRESYYIRNEVDFVESDGEGVDAAAYVHLFDSDSYYDLLYIEEAVRKLKLNQKDKLLYVLLRNNKDIQSMCDTLRLSKPTVIERTKLLTGRIAFLLGGKFTDDGFADYICTKYGYDEYIKTTLLHFLKRDNQ
jgi:hypothetical protein